MNEILRTAVLSLDADGRGLDARLNMVGNHASGTTVVETSELGTGNGTYSAAFATATYLVSDDRARHVIA